MNGCHGDGDAVTSHLHGTVLHQTSVLAARELGVNDVYSYERNSTVIVNVGVLSACRQACHLHECCPVKMFSVGLLARC